MSECEWLGLHWNSMYTDSCYACQRRIERVWWEWLIRRGIGTVWLAGHQLPKPGLIRSQWLGLLFSVRAFVFWTNYWHSILTENGYTWQGNAALWTQSARIVPRSFRKPRWIGKIRFAISHIELVNPEVLYIIVEIVVKLFRRF